MEKRRKKNSFSCVHRKKEPSRKEEKCEIFLRQEKQFENEGNSSDNFIKMRTNLDGKKFLKLNKT